MQGLPVHTLISRKKCSKTFAVVPWQQMYITNGRFAKMISAFYYQNSIGKPFQNPPPVSIPLLHFWHLKLFRKLLRHQDQTRHQLIINLRQSKCLLVPKNPVHSIIFFCRPKLLLALISTKFIRRRFSNHAYIQYFSF